MPVLPIVPANHYSLLSVVSPDGTVLRFDTKDKTMDQDALFGKYWRLFSDVRFTRDLFQEMKSADWMGLVKHWEFNNFKEKCENYRKKVEKAERDASERKLEVDYVVLTNQVNEQQQQLANAQDEIN
jgi:hypothetical protein